MKGLSKVIKWFLIAIVVIVGIIVIIPVVFKGKIVEIAKEEINNNVNAVVDFGDFDLSLLSTFPNFKFEINNLSIIGINEFKEDTLANIQQFRVKIGLFSVMSDRLKIKSILIDHPQIYAKVLANGKANWDIAAEENATAETETTNSETNFQLLLEEFKIVNADIIYDDREMNLVSTMKNMDFNLNGDLSADFTSLNIQTQIEELSLLMDGIPYLKKAQAEAFSQIDADLINSKYTFKENVLKINELELGFDGFVAMPDTNIDLDITFEAQKTEFKYILSLVPAIYLNDFKDVKTSGKVALQGFAKGTYNSVQLPAFDLSLLVEDAMFQYPDLPAKADDINMNLQISNKDGIEDHTIIDLKNFHINFASNPFDMSMLITTPISDPNIDGSLKGIIDLAKIKEVMPVEVETLSGIINADMEIKGKMSSIENEQYEQFHAIGNIQLQNLKYSASDFTQGISIHKAEMQLSPQYIQLVSFESEIGKSDMNMSGKIENFLAYYFKDELLKGSFSFNSKLLDLNELMGDEESEEISEETTDEMMVVEVPKNIDFKLNTTIQKLLYDSLEMTNVGGSVSLKEGIASMENLEMNMLQGQIQMNGSYSSQDINKPAIDLDIAINNFDIRQTFDAFNTIQKIAPIAEKCSGKFSMNFDVKGLIQHNMEPDLSTINSNGSFQANNIKINNADIFNKIGGLVKSDKFKTIALSNVDLTYTIVGGNITIKPFETKFGKSTMLIGGTQNLDESIHYNIKFKVPSSEFGSEANKVAQGLFSQAGQFGVDLQVPKNIQFNAIIGGTLKEPTVKLDLKNQAANMTEDLKEQAKEKLKQEADKAKQDAIKKAKEQAAQLLAEADKQGKKLIAEARKTANQIKSSANKNADLVKAEVYKQADDLVKEAGNDMVKKVLAEQAAKTLRTEADKNASLAKNEAAKKADGIVKKAQKQSNALKAKAKKEGDAIIAKAEAV